MYKSSESYYSRKLQANANVIAVTVTTADFNLKLSLPLYIYDGIFLFREFSCTWQLCNCGRILFQICWKSVFDEMNISFSKPPECILRDSPTGEGPLSHPGGQWLPGASINPAQNCININGKRGLNDTVIIWREEQHDDLPLQRMTLKELREEVWYATNSPSLLLLAFYTFSHTVFVNCIITLENLVLLIVILKTLESKAKSYYWKKLILFVTTFLNHYLRAMFSKTVSNKCLLYILTLNDKKNKRIPCQC